MKLTRRGWVVLAIGIVAVAMAVAFGARSLNAVVGGVLVTFIAGFVFVKRASPPTVVRTLPYDATVGERVTIDVSLDVDDPYLGTVVDTVDGGVVEGNEQRITVTETTFSYDVELGSRGRVAVGPLRVRATDAFGVLTTEFVVASRDEIVVSPRVRDVVAASRYGLPTRRDGLQSRSRTAFERLREYTTGDGLRDVHWKSTAKNPDDDLVVAEFTGETSGGIELVCTSPPGRADAMAEAAASLAVYFLQIGYRVVVTTADGTIDAHPRDDPWDDLMHALALTDGGSVDRSQTDHDVVRVEEQADGTAVVTVGSRSVPFSSLVTPEPGEPEVVLA